MAPLDNAKLVPAECTQWLKPTGIFMTAYLHRSPASSLNTEAKKQEKPITLSHRAQSDIVYCVNLA